MAATPASVKDESVDFKRFIGYLKSVSGIATVLTAFLPIGGEWLKAFVPPWPERVHYFTSPISFAAIIITFLAWRTSSLDAIERRRKHVFGIGVVLALLYVAMLAYFVTEIDGAIRVTAGLGLTVGAKQYIGNDVLKGSVPDLIQFFGSTDSAQDRIWTNRWVSKFILTTLFVTPFVLVSAGLTLLVLRNVILDKSRPKS